MKKLLTVVYSKFGIQDIILFLNFIALLFVNLHCFMVDPGVGWHLLAGKWIFEHVALPIEDPFLAVSRPWILEQWLAELVIFCLYKLGDFALLATIGISFYLSTFFVVLYYYCKRFTHDNLVIVFIISFIAKLCTFHFLLRPVLFSFVCFVIVCGESYSLLRAIKNNTDNKFRVFKRCCLVVPIAFILWANLHPSFFIGLFVCGLVPVSLVIDRFILKETIEIPFKKLSIFVLLSCGATLINPYGFEIHKLTLTISSSQFLRNFFQEWLPLEIFNFSKQYIIYFWGMMLFFLYGLIFAKEKKNKIGSFELILLSFLFYESLSSVRILAYFAIALAFPLTEIITSLIQTYLRGVQLKNFAVFWQEVSEREGKTTHGWFQLLLLSLIFITYSVFTHKVPFFNGDLQPNKERYPYQALDILKKDYQGQPIIVANLINYGGFISWYGDGKVKAVIDDRAYMYGLENLQHYDELYSKKYDWCTFMQENNADYLLISAKSKLAKKIKKKHWKKPIFEDKNFVMYEGGC